MVIMKGRWPSVKRPKPIKKNMVITTKIVDPQILHSLVVPNGTNKLSRAQVAAPERIREKERGGRKDI
jgi:hypothetical protein